MSSKLAGVPALMVTLVISLPASVKPTKAVSPTLDDVPAPTSVIDWLLAEFFVRLDGDLYALLENIRPL
jgi:hypothetical protein